jgi:hypothetical protein
VLSYDNQQISLPNVLLDTGSAGTIFSADAVISMGLTYEPEDTVHRIRGVGGAEFVFTKRVEALTLDELNVADFEIEIGLMDYGFDIDGIIGMDFLTQTGSVIDLKKMEIHKAQ